jgi:hypothetical protein
MGAEAIQQLLADIDLEAEIAACVRSWQTNSETKIKKTVQAPEADGRPSCSPATSRSGWC